VVGNRHPVGIPTEITQGLLGTANWGLGLEAPLFWAQSLDERVEGMGGLQVEGGACEAQGVLGVKTFSPIEIVGPKDGAQGFDRQEARGRRGLPGLPCIG
jgi:hypothetical protein